MVGNVLVLCLNCYYGPSLRAVIFIFSRGGVGMQMKGALRKMAITADEEGKAHYALRLDDSALPLNGAVGRTVRLVWTGAIRCVHCQRSTNKSFAQGHCYPCFKRLASCDTCIMSPERCHYAQGTCREPAWGEQHCMAPHLVYLANSSALKVGITKPSQLPTRWLDQGATQAVPILDVDSRLQSGWVEDTLRSEISDRTSWQAMLKGEAAELDMAALRTRVLAQFEPQLDALRAQWGADAIRVRSDVPRRFHYPVQAYPAKVKSFNLDRQPIVEGQLMGLKGQYLILDNGVINLRKYAGYHVDFSVVS